MVLAIFKCKYIIMHAGAAAADTREKSSRRMEPCW
jgi:hypothetical protein